MARVQLTKAGSPGFKRHTQKTTNATACSLEVQWMSMSDNLTWMTICHESCVCEGSCVVVIQINRLDTVRSSL